MKLSKLQQLVILQPDNLQAHQELVTRYLDSGKQQKAIRCLRAIIQRWPNHVDAYSMLGSIYLKQSDWSNAGKAFMRITQLYPERVRAWVTLAYIFDRLNNYKEAIKCCQKALLLKPDLEKALHILAFALLKSGQHEKAKVALEELTEKFQAPVEAEYILAAFNEDGQPEQSPEEYVRTVFDGYAENFENNLVNVLKYNVPETLNVAIRKLLPENSSQLKVIDLGCGTGLMGEKIKDISSYLTGVDLSEKMLAQAEKKQIYDVLLNKDVLDSISEVKNNYDLVVATDVFIYIGKLSSVFKKVFQSMKKGGLFGFSIELTEHNSDYILQHTGGYAQSIEYIRKLAGENDFQLCTIEKIIVRMEQCKPVDGCIFVLKKE